MGLAALSMPLWQGLREPSPLPSGQNSNNLKQGQSRIPLGPLLSGSEAHFRALDRSIRDVTKVEWGKGPLATATGAEPVHQLVRQGLERFGGHCWRLVRYPVIIAWWWWGRQYPNFRSTGRGMVRQVLSLLVNL